MAKEIKGFSPPDDNLGMELLTTRGEEKRRVRQAEEERVVRLIHAYRNDGDSRAVEELMSMHERLLNSIVRRHSRTSGEPYEDLLQVGSVGLLKAVQGYEADGGARFASYAYAMIDGEIRHHHRDTRIVKRPRWAQSVYARISEAEAGLTEKLGRPPSVEEVAEEANVTPEGIREVTRLFHETDAASLEEQPDPSAIRSLRHESFSLPLEDRIVLEQALDSLSELQRKVVYLFFYKDLTQTEIGQSLGMSQRKVSRVVASATGALAGFFRS
jgi:RNA polymerase sigma-B factor